MNISLYYVRGLSPLDEPKFNSKSHQQQFFENYKVVEIDTTYYPPHYTNTIRLDVNDIDFNEQANYLSLNYNNKIYYYFIQSIRYINEYVFEVNIVLDTIQTYMFDIVYNNFTVNRYSMKRWKKLSNGREVINRDYERENLSLTDKYVEKFQRNEVKPYLIIQARKLQDNSLNKPTNIYYQDIEGDNTYNDFTDGCEYYILPLPNQELYSTTRIWNVDISGLQDTPVSMNKRIVDIIDYLSESPYVLNLFYCNNDNFYNNYPYQIYESDNSIFINPSTSGYHLDVVDVSDFKLIYIRDFFSKSTYKNLAELFTIEKNQSLKQPFDKKYIPQLIDENYYELKFGEKLGYTSYPLHKVFDSDDMQGEYYYNITNGNRIYKIKGIKDINISPTSKYEYIDKYFTGITNSTIQIMPTYNNQYQRYLSTNKGTLTTGLALAKQENIYKGVVEGIKDTSKLATSIISQSPTGIVSSASNLAFVGANMMFNAHKIDTQYQIAKENYEYAPDSTKSGNEFTSDVVGNNVETMYSVSQVDDLDVVAFKLETLGYSYRIIKSNNDLSYNLFNDDELLPRYYYNIIRCENMNVSFKVLVSEDIKQDIITRFTNGLRMWNTSLTNVSAEYIGNFSYDNIEKENIKGGN